MGTKNYKGQILLEIIFSLTLFITLIMAFNMLGKKSVENSLYLTKPKSEK